MITFLEYIILFAMNPIVLLATIAFFIYVEFIVAKSILEDWSMEECQGFIYGKIEKLRVLFHGYINSTVNAHINSFVGESVGVQEKRSGALTPLQQTMLDIIASHHNIDVAGISHILGLAKSTVKKSLKPLVYGGYITRTVNPRDHRTFAFNVSYAYKTKRYLKLLWR